MRIIAGIRRQIADFYTLWRFAKFGLEYLGQTKALLIALLTALFFFLIFWWSLPTPLFDAPLSGVLEDQKGTLLSARIANDGQWRFPASDSLPETYVKALIAFEDQRFYHHQGVDPISLSRAMLQNLSKGRVVSGGSTITMQVIRLARHDRSRSIWQKMIEAYLAIRLDFSHRKKSILKLYAANAPFGGNVVGLEAASWRYFGKAPVYLSWAEGALMAILPNSPALIHPGRNRNVLLAKRNRLLDKLAKTGVIDATTADLAKAEELPTAPLPLPKAAPHLLDRMIREKGAMRVVSSLDVDLQMRVLDIARRRHDVLRFNQIHNLAILVADVESGEVLAYVGNAPETGAQHGQDVDIITAPRSTGSILKPFLYGLAMQDGIILPQSWLPDVPLTISGYRPENFEGGHEGLIAANEALARSLNIPFVSLLQQYRVPRFHYHLQKMGLKTLTQHPDHYGLSLILGGAEANLWDLCGIYAAMARSLGHFWPYNSRYDAEDWHPLTYLPTKPKTQRWWETYDTEAQYLNAGSIWSTFEAMQEVRRPGEEGEWERFTSNKRVAWKTGTSFGFRDAWAIGLTPRYVVGVWAGNADGEGRPGLVGTQVAAPILFEVMGLLPSRGWFKAPYDDLKQVPICSNSGFRASKNCPVDSAWVPKKALNGPLCQYHQLVHLDESGAHQVTQSCNPGGQIQHVSWLQLPPLEEYYFRQKHPEFKALPPFHPGCGAAAGGNPMQLIYPRQAAKIYVPIDLDGQRSKTIFQVAHRKPDTKIYWHLDEDYVGTTQTFHQYAFAPPPGKHVLTLVDEQGNRLEQRFEIVLKN
jgi:penicillin-binding protein 1C